MGDIIMELKRCTKCGETKPNTNEYFAFSNKSKGIVLSTANKWRSIDGYSQAASYIRSAMNGLKSDTQSKL